MDELAPLLDFVQQAEVAARLDVALAAHERELAADLRAGVRRRALVADAELRWNDLALRSLWLVSHRALRRAGLRQHPESSAVLVAWRGEGLVLLRGEGDRRSVALVPRDREPGEGSARYVVIPPDTLYDTLADSTVWHLLAFQTQAAAQLTRLEPSETGWNQFAEDVQKP